MLRTLLFLSLLGPPAFSHPLDLGVLSLDMQGNEVRAQLDLNPKAAADLLEIPETHLTPLNVAGHAGSLMKATLGGASLEQDRLPCPWQLPEAQWLAQAVRLTTTARCSKAVTQLSGDFTFVLQPKLPATFQLMVRATAAGQEQADILDRQHPQWTSHLRASPGLGSFVRMGMEHIGATPNQWFGATGLHLPDGIDHLLFLLALVLGGGTWWELVKAVSGFTVGHSITLALATLGIVHLPSRLVESAIALSILYLAFEALMKKGAKGRWRLAAFFGLVHGLGFASALTELNLSGMGLVRALVGFNVGVELGQALLLLIMVPTLALARRQEKLNQYALPACSFLIFAIGSYWFVQRAWG